MTQNTTRDPNPPGRLADCGALIVFSGMDSSGKSTQIRLLIKELRACHHEPVVLWTRVGYTMNFNRLKQLVPRVWRRHEQQGDEPVERHYPHRASTLPHPLKRWLYLTFSMLDLIWIYGIQVRLWQRLGRIVICDRYLWDSQVDFRVFFPDDHVEQRLLWRVLDRITPKPDAAFFLLVPVEASMERSIKKTRRYQETPDVLEERRRQYFAVAAETEWPVLDGMATASNLTVNIRRQIGAALCMDFGQTAPWSTPG